MTILNNPIGQPAEFIVASGNAKLTVRFYARQESETVILLHGGPGVPDEMTEVRDWFRQYFQVVSFDQRGIGKKAGEHCTFTMDDYIQDVSNIMDHFGIVSFHVFGHSWGGLYAQLYAHKHPERLLSLFLCSPASGTGKIWSQTEKEVFRYNYERSTFFEWIGMGFNTFLGMLGNKKAYRGLFRQIIINYHKGFCINPPDEEKLARINPKAGLETRKQIKKYPVTGIFGKTDFPVMITYGAFDAYGESKEFVYERFRYANRAIIPNAGHAAWKHNWSGFRNILYRFYIERSSFAT
jgi:proline iminopeptidase